MLKGLPPERIAFQDVIYISRIRWEWSYGSVAFLSNSRNLSDLFAWEKKLFQSNWSLFGHKYSYDFRILNTESYFIIILKFKKYFKMLKKKKPYTINYYMSFLSSSLLFVLLLLLLPLLHWKNTDHHMNST